MKLPIPFGLLACVLFSAFTCAHAQLAPPIVGSGTSAGSLTTGTVLVLNQGDSAFFAATPSGSGSFSYQWKKDGMNLPAQTGSTLMFESLRKENIGYYTVTVGNGGSSATSTPVALGINGVSFGAWQGLAAFYKFSGDATDATDFANDGTAVNVTAAPDRFGNPNEAFQFDGTSSYVGWPDSVFGPDVNGFTFSLWATCNQSTAPEGWYLMNHGAINGEAAVLSTGTSYAFQVLLTDAIWHKIEAPAVLGTYQVSVVYERGKRLELWLNGQLAASQVPPDLPLAAKPYLPNPSSIGAYRSWDPPRSIFTGVIDDVRIYTRALSASDIQALYAEESLPSPPVTLPPAPGTLFSGTSSDTLATGSSLTLNPGGSAYFSVALPTSGTFNTQWKKDGINLPAQTGSNLVLSNLKPEDIGYYTATITTGTGTITSTPVALGLNGVSFGAWQGLVAYYKFSGDATDSSGFGNDGTAFNVTGTTDRFGFPNQAFHFDGSSSYVGWPDALFGPNTPGFTFSAWVKADHPSSSGQWTIMNHGAINGEAELETTGTSCLFALKMADSAWYSTAEVPSAPGLVHVIGVYERGARMELWINGTLVSSRIPPALDLFSANYPNPSSIGGARGTNGLVRAFCGTIDDVKIFGRALSASDIQALHAAESLNIVPPPSDPAPGTILSGTSSDTVASGSSLALNQGASAYFSVAVPTSGTFTIQWKKDGMSLPSQTGSTLVLSNLKPENIGYYTATISTETGTITSTPVALGLNGIPFGAWQGLAAYYQFSGDASDSSGLGNNGTAVNVTGATDRYGMPNQAFHFNGSSSYVGWPDQIISPTTAGFTFSVWVKPDRATLPEGWCIMNHGAINGEAGLNTTGTTYEFQVKLSDSNWYRTAWVSHALGLVHVVGVYERGTRLQLWLDGQLVSTVVPPSLDLFAAPYLPNPSSIGAGRTSVGLDTAFPGILDDVKIFNRALSESEVQALYGQETVRSGGNSTSVVVAKDGSVPDFPDTRFVALGSPAMNNQLHVAFAATVAGTTPGTIKSLRAGKAGIWADDSSGARHLIAFEGHTAPGTNSAKFREFGDPIINNNEVIAFNASLAGAGVSPGNAEGIWSSEGGSLRLMARQRQQAPGCRDGVLFRSFESFALPDQGGASNTGGIILLANVFGPGVNSTNDKGIWAVGTNGSLELVLREGDMHPITGKTIRKLYFLPKVAGLGDGQTRGFAQGTGDFIYKAEFTDGSWGVYQSLFP